MPSPWLDIPLSDYEGHMSLPSVSQATMVTKQFADLLAEFSPASVAVIGCAGGNGFEHACSESISRVVGVDINPHYIEALSSRYAKTIPGLELYVADVQELGTPFDPVDFIYAALVFEYVDLSRTLRNLKAICRPDGILAVVLQLASESVAPVSPSPFTSLLSLAPAMRLVPPSDFSVSSSAQGFLELSSRHVSLPSGKEFVMKVFRLRTPLRQLTRIPGDRVLRLAGGQRGASVPRSA